MGKKFFWIKLKDNFFKQLTIKKLRKVAGGDTFVIIYLKMMLLSMNEGGKISYECEAGEFVENLALDIDEDEDNVQITLSFLKANGMLEYLNEKEVFLNEVPDCTGAETEGAERVRKHRKLKNEREKALQNSDDVTQALQCNNDVTDTKQECTENVTLEIRDKRIRDKSIDNTIPKVSTSNKVSTVVVVAEEKEKEKEEELAAAADIVNLWNNNIHPIVPLEAEMLLDLIKDCGKANVKKAIQKAVKANARNMGYVEGTAKGLANGVDYDDIKPKQESFDEAVRMLQEKYEAEANGGNK